MSTALHDVASAAFLAAGLYPDTVSSSPTGPTIDMLTADGPCFAVQQVGEFAADSLTGRIEESADTSTWAAVSGAAFAAVDAASNLQAITFTRTKRYLRYAADLVGDTPAVELAVLIGEQRKTL
jgi:hypothetical protein